MYGFGCKITVPEDLSIRYSIRNKREKNLFGRL